jgi:hypothetical protein
MENKLLFNSEMNESEIGKALNLLKEALRREVLSYTHANPVKDNCYISSNYISGLYFPNSVITLNSDLVYNAHKNYRFSCIAKIENKLCFVYALKDEASDNIKKILKPFIYDEIESMIYSYEERQVKSNLESKLKDYTQRKEKLLSIKRVYKKDKSDFALLNKCFTNCNITFEYSYFDNTLTAYNLTYNECIYRSDEQRKKPLTANEIEQAIKEKIAYYSERISDTKNALKNLYKNIVKMKKLIKTCKAFFDSLTNGEEYAIKEQFKRDI